MDSDARNLDRVSSNREFRLTQSEQEDNAERWIERRGPLGETVHVQRLLRDLETCDWEQLEDRYASAMKEHGRAEENLRLQMTELLEVFMAWSQITVLRDESRALKRFKTQMQHVQISEERLESKRKHYIEVVKAFETALALLNERVKH